MKVTEKYGERGGLVVIYPVENDQRYITIQNKPQGTDSFTKAKISCSAFVMSEREAIKFLQAMLEALDYARKINVLYCVS